LAAACRARVSDRLCGTSRVVARTCASTSRSLGGERASLIVDCGLGVSEERIYRTYRIDSDFFEEGELLFGLDHQGRSVAAHAAAIMNAPSS
jgi:hypothetical protein